jgi:hypothetical protein
MNHESLLNLMEELTDLTELHARNNLNLCIMGGMVELLSIGIGYPNDEVKRVALYLISSVCSNNLQV